MSELKNTEEKKKLVFVGSEIHFEVGGGYFFLFNLARTIAQTDSYEVFCVNVPNERLEKIYLNDNIHFISVHKCDFTQFEGADFVVPLNYMFYFLNRARNIKQGRILLYNWHPDANLWLNNQILYWYNNYNNLMSYLGSKKSLYFMDESCFLSMNMWCDYKFDKNIIPVFPSTPQQSYQILEIINPNRISLGWLGRLDPDKINSVINLLDQLALSKLDIPIDVHIIGDGKSKNKINAKKYTSKINVIFTSYLYGDARDKYIRSNIDIMVAVGMAALDATNLSIPTVIPIMSPNRFTNNQFVFLFDTYGYSLSWNPEALSELNVKTHTIDEVMQKVCTPGGKSSLGFQCYNYMDENFNVEKSSRRVLDALEQSQLSVPDCLAHKVIRKQLKSFDLYKKLRKREYTEFRGFANRINRMKGKSIIEKTRIIAKIIAGSIKNRNK